MLVGLAVADVAAAERAEPEPLHHLACGEVAPGVLEVALVPALVVDDRLAILVAEADPAVHVRGLEAGVRHPVLRVVVPLAAVVDAAQPLVRVLLLEDREEPVPVLPLLVAAVAAGPLIGHEVVLVGQRPPDVAIRREPGDAVPQVAVVLGVAHLREAPAVVGVPEDDVRLDAQLLEVEDAPLEQPPELGVRPAEVELAVGPLPEGEELRLVLVGDVVALGEDAEADLVERRGGERLERLLLELAGLMHPGVAGGAELVIGRAVGVAQVERLEDLDRPVIVRRRRPDGERAGLAVQLGPVAPRLVAPRALRRRREADLVGAIAVVEAAHRHALAVMAERAGEFHVEVGIALARPVQRCLPHAPLLDVGGPPDAGEEDEHGQAPSGRQAEDPETPEVHRCDSSHGRRGDRILFAAESSVDIASLCDPTGHPQRLPPVSRDWPDVSRFSHDDPRVTPLNWGISCGILRSWPASTRPVPISRRMDSAACAGRRRRCRVATATTRSSLTSWRTGGWSISWAGGRSSSPRGG